MAYAAQTHSYKVTPLPESIARVYRSHLYFPKRAPFNARTQLYLPYKAPAMLMLVTLNMPRAALSASNLKACRVPTKSTSSLACLTRYLGENVALSVMTFSVSVEAIGICGLTNGIPLAQAAKSARIGSI